jgi:CheY-like chemotaxis protein
LTMGSNGDDWSVNASTLLRVLLADDDPRHRGIGGALLSVWGIEPVFACDGAQALKLVVESGFDIVLMDIVMPNMDGLVATREIRRFEQENHSQLKVPIVAYSATELAPEILQRVGLSAMLRKPADTTSMGDCLRRWCGEKFLATSTLGAAPAG